MWPFISLSNHIMMNTKYHDAKVLDAMQSWDFSDRWSHEMRKYAKEESMKFANCQRSFSSSFLASKKTCDINGSYGVMDFIHKLSFDAKSLFLLRVKKILHVSDTSFFISQSDHLVSDLGTRRVFIKRLFTSRAPIFYTELFFHSGGSLHSSLP